MFLLTAHRTSGHGDEVMAPFLTSDTGQVLWLVSLWLAAGVTADVAYLAYDPLLLNSLGDLVTIRDRAGGDPHLARIGGSPRAVRPGIGAPAG